MTTLSEADVDAVTLEWLVAQRDALLLKLALGEVGVGSL